MEQLKEALVGCGIGREALDAMDDAQIKNLARAMKLDPAQFLPREVRVEIGKNGAEYVVTEGYPVPKFKDKKLVPGETSLSRNLYVRKEAIPQIIEDLLPFAGTTDDDE